LNDTVLYRNLNGIKQALEQENPEAKQEYQISDETIKNLQSSRD
jgi:hypothetical protein